MNGLDRCLVSFVPVPFIGSSGGGIAQVVHRSAVEQVVTLTAGVTVCDCLRPKKGPVLIFIQDISCQNANFAHCVARMKILCAVFNSEILCSHICENPRIRTGPFFGRK